MNSVERDVARRGRWLSDPGLPLLLNAQEAAECAVCRRAHGVSGRLAAPSHVPFAFSAVDCGEWTNCARGSQLAAHLAATGSNLNVKLSIETLDLVGGRGTLSHPVSKPFQNEG